MKCQNWQVANILLRDSLSTTLYSKELSQHTGAGMVSRGLMIGKSRVQHAHVWDLDDYR